MKILIPRQSFAHLGISIFYFILACCLSVTNAHLNAADECITEGTGGLKQKCNGTQGVVCGPNGEGCQPNGPEGSSNCLVDRHAIAICHEAQSLDFGDLCDCYNKVTIECGTTAYWDSNNDCLGPEDLLEEWYGCGCEE